MQVTDTAAGTREYPSATKGWWATAVFFLLYALSFIDRQLLGLLVEPIKAQLHVSDFEISLLQGMSFAIFYALFGIAIGWMVDHWARRPIVFAGVTLWSLATAGCGLASQYWHLMLGRIGVATGEASLAPAAYSMLSDIFPPRRLALPMSVMGSGAPLGGAFALILGGFVLGMVPAGGVDLPIVGTLVGWQVAFVVVGLPGLLLAPLIFTVPDIRRVPMRSDGQGQTIGMTLRRLMTSRRFYAGHFLGFGFYSLINYAVSSWMPTFLIRRHGLDLGQAGYATGLLLFFVSLPGSILVGYLVDRWFGKGRKDAHLRFFAGCAAVQLVSLAAAVSVDDPWLALALLIPHTAVVSFTGVAAAGLQIATPPDIRGQVSAIYLLVFNLLGLGLGPMVVALFTDFVFQDEARLGSSLLLTYVVFAPLAILCMLFAAPAMRERVTLAEAGWPEKAEG